MSDEPKKKPDEKEPGSEYTRREFLVWASAAGLTPIIQQRQVRQLTPQKKTLQLATLPAFTVSVLRPDDLLNLEFEFVNLKLVPGNPPKLVRQNPASPAYLIVHFPPQSIAEEAFWEAAKEFKPAPDPAKSRIFQLQANSDVPRTPPVLSRISGRSRLAFRIPDDIPEIPYTLESLLAWDLLEPSLVPVALPPVTLSGGMLIYKEIPILGQPGQPQAAQSQAALAARQHKRRRVSGCGEKHQRRVD